MKTAIILHLYYQDLWPWFKSKISPILQSDPSADLYVTVNDLNTTYAKDIKQFSKKLFLVENKGVDVAPFLYVCNEIKDIPYKYYIKLHGKKSPHTPRLGDTWREELVNGLINNTEHYHYLKNYFKDKNEPMLGCTSKYLLSEKKKSPNFQASLPFINKVLDLISVDSKKFFSVMEKYNDIDSSINKKEALTSVMPPFSAGTMFIINDVYYKNLLKLLDIPSVLPFFEKGYLRDSLAHGFERLFGYFTFYFKGFYSGIPIPPTNAQNPTHKMKIIYRISDIGYNKVKPNYINNEACLANAVETFGKENFIVIADNVSKDTYSMICKYVKESQIKKVYEGNGAKTFNIALDIALEETNDTLIYFLENDYLHLYNSLKILEEGFTLGADFVSLYDHPDKYLDPSQGGNPYCEGRAEDTRVYLTNSCHWKITNSTTMTFASKVNTLKEVEPILRKHTSSSHPDDFKIFLELRQNNKLLVTPLPGCSTHGETAWLTPLTNWSQI